MEEELELYHFLKKHVPQTSNESIVEFMENVEAKREKLVRIHRIITISPFLTSKISFEGLIPQPHYLPSFIFRPQEVIPPKISPQILQQVAQLYQMVQQDASNLFQAVLKLKGTTSFYFLIQSSIPSIYGFFSSKEHIQLAFPFYVNAVSIEDKSIATEILLPFFRTPCMYRFYESTVFSLLERMRSETRFKKGKLPDSILLYYQQILLQAIYSSLPLLTQSHTTLLKMMLQQWGETDFINFFINTLLYKFSATWFQNNSLELRIPILRSIFDLIINDEKIKSEICEKVQANTSNLELPNNYISFGHQYILILTTSADFVTVLNAYSQVKSIPMSIINAKADITNNFHLFWVKIFYRRNIPQIQINRPIVFSQTYKMPEGASDYERIFLHLESQTNDPYDQLINSKELGFVSNDVRKYILRRTISYQVSQSRKFERMMEFRLCSKQLDRWIEISEAGLRLSITQIAEKAANMAFERGYKCMNFAFRKASTMFDERLLRQMQFLVLAQSYFSKYISGLEKDINKVNDWWFNLLQQKNTALDDIYIEFTTKSANGLFWECVEVLQTISLEDFKISFRNIMRVVRNIDQIATTHSHEREIMKTRSLFEKAVILGKSFNLLSIYLAVGPICMDNQAFKDLCTEEEQRYWVIFEALIFTLLNNETEMYTIISKVQEKLRNIEKDGDDSIEEN